MDHRHTQDISSQNLKLEGLKHIMVEENSDGFVATLVDNSGFEIVRGFGSDTTEALNDLHSNLI